MNENLPLYYELTGSLPVVVSSSPEVGIVLMSCPMSPVSTSRLSELRRCNCGRPWSKLDVMRPRGKSLSFAIVHHAEIGS